MPFRKLPVTDDELLRTMINLIRAYDRNVTNQPDPLKQVRAFTAETYDRLKELQPSFEKEYTERSGALASQSGSTMLKNQAQRKLKKCVDHFFMVLNLAIDREVYNPAIRAMYGIDVNRKNIPIVYSHSDLSYWAENIISGETRRITNGGLPMTNPSLADVQVAFDDFESRHRELMKLKNNYDLQQEDVEHMRRQVKETVRDAWDQVEFYFRKDKPSSLRRKARNWGVEYGTRKGEKPEESTE
jgi:hypothetical protein